MSKGVQEEVMKKGVQLVVYPVKDIARAKTVYGKLLGIEPYAESPYYVGYRIGEQEIGLDPNGHRQGLSGPLGYYQVKDIKWSLQSLLDAGAQQTQGVKDVGGGKLIAWLKDADGNPIGLVQEP